MTSPTPRRGLLAVLGVACAAALLLRWHPVWGPLVVGALAGALLPARGAVWRTAAGILVAASGWLAVPALLGAPLLPLAARFGRLFGGAPGWGVLLVAVLLPVVQGAAAAGVASGLRRPR